MLQAGSCFTIPPWLAAALNCSINALGFLESTRVPSVSSSSSSCCLRLPSAEPFLEAFCPVAGVGEAVEAQVFPSSPSESSESFAARVAFAAEPEKRVLLLAGRPRDLMVLPNVPVAACFVRERGIRVAAVLPPGPAPALTFFLRPEMCWVRAERVGGALL